MDNVALNDLLLHSEGKQFWIVLWGDPDCSSDEEPQLFNDPMIEHWFPMHPASMKPGDILFAHRIKVSTLIFVAEVISSPRRHTDEEMRKDSRQKRWAWSVDTKNLTPTYGEHWREYSLRTFPLSKEYNKLNPQDHVNIGRLNFGAPTRISRGFAQFLLNQIIMLS
jgi:hypothetical protein